MFAVPEGPSEAKIPITVRRIHLIRRPYAKRRGRRETMFDCPLSKTVKILDQRSCRNTTPSKILARDSPNSSQETGSICNLLFILQSLPPPSHSRDGSACPESRTNVFSQKFEDFSRFFEVGSFRPWRRRRWSRLAERSPKPVFPTKTDKGKWVSDDTWKIRRFPRCTSRPRYWPVIRLGRIQMASI